jgi:cytochrome c oxidase subunit IV
VSSVPHIIPPKVYWISWSALLALTLVMLGLDSAPLPRAIFVVLMLAAMLTKATVIGGNFMHLRSERVSLALTVVAGLLLTGAILFALIAPDAIRIRDMAAGGR